MVQLVLVLVLDQEMFALFFASSSLLPSTTTPRPQSKAPVPYVTLYSRISNTGHENEGPA
jgi:hypothetical protein